MACVRPRLLIVEGFHAPTAAWSATGPLAHRCEAMMRRAYFDGRTTRQLLPASATSTIETPIAANAFFPPPMSSCRQRATGRRRCTRG